MQRPDDHNPGGLTRDTAADSVLPPIAVFGDPRLPRPQEHAALCDIRPLMSALAAFDGFAVAADRERALEHVHRTASAAAEELAAVVDPPPPPPPLSATQQYFRVRTGGAVSADQALQQVLQVLATAALDLCDAPVSGSDLDRLARAMSVIIEQYRPSPTAATTSPSPKPDARRHIEEVWLRRWTIAHQMHAMLNIHAAYLLADAVAALDAGNHHRAAQLIDQTTQVVRGFAPARAHALAVPAAFYDAALRPTMLPPLTAAPLSGRMHVEFRAYQQRLDDLLALLPQPSAELAASQPALALARERLVEADLIDAERHVTSVEPLVGGERSLIQTSKSLDNAVSMLRRIRHRRAARAAPLVRFPDRGEPEEL